MTFMVGGTAAGGHGAVGWELTSSSTNRRQRAFGNLSLSPSHTSLNKPTPPVLSQIVLPAISQAFKYMSL